MNTARLDSSTAHALTAVPAARAARIASAHGGSRTRLWTGRVLSGLCVLFLSLDGLVKLFPIDAVIEGTTKIGFPLSTIVPLGIVLLSCVFLYALPRTAVFGALLLTGYLGGAIATHVRVGDPLFSHTLFPIYVAVLVWAGLVLRDDRLRAALGLPGPRA